MKSAIIHVSDIALRYGERLVRDECRYSQAKIVTLSAAAFSLGDWSCIFELKPPELCDQNEGLR